MERKLTAEEMRGCMQVLSAVQAECRHDSGLHTHSQVLEGERLTITQCARCLMFNPAPVAKRGT